VFDVAGSPTGIAVTADEIWAASPRAGQISVLDARSGRPLGPPLTTGGTPARIAPAATGAWVADTANGAVVATQLRPRRRVFEPIPLGADVTDVALAARAVWAISSAEAVVRVLEPGGRPVRAVPVGSRPVALDADERRVVVATAGDGGLTVIDARTRRPAGDPVRVGGSPVAVALAGDDAWVADAGRDAVLRVDLGRRTVDPPIRLDGKPVAIAADGDDVYAVDRDRMLVHVEDGEVRSRRSAGTQPTALGLSAGHVWVADAGAGTVMRFDR
jgi:DNA-binding beta-propeller fold protein YncE